ncbi:MAG: hypothetical protein K0Q70_539 [Rhodospirillales bacterium]|jgi:uncharacterized protein (TIGR00255 family)|nr:hypothetical protein [Rhodospirillales bacterium]
MTGFARATGESNGRSWNWEVKSVNGKGLDVRCRLPLGSDALEAAVRAQAAERVKRGNLSVSLTVRRDQAQGQYRVNEELLRHLLETATAVDTIYQPRVDALLNVKGVVETADEADEDEDQKKAREAKMLIDLGTALDALAGMRAEEGRRLGVVLGEQIGEIERLTAAAADLAETQPAAIRARLVASLADLLGASPALSEDRLIQEVALLATRADVREELDRLRAHVAAARQLIGDGNVVGRKLDFLCQEFTREANTLCSKAQDVDMTRIGIELKTVIEQFREQVQNIE